MRLLLRDTRGTVMVEYVIVLALVSVGASLALIGLGTELLQLFRYQEAVLLLPFP
jgi:Flp pilus assembly pilin Flp